jgi:hypothetical protein
MPSRTIIPQMNYCDHCLLVLNIEGKFGHLFCLASREKLAKIDLLPQRKFLLRVKSDFRRRCC